MWPASIPSHGSLLLTTGLMKPHPSLHRAFFHHVCLTHPARSVHNYHCLTSFFLNVPHFQFYAAFTNPMLVERLSNSNNGTENPISFTRPEAYGDKSKGKTEEDSGKTGPTVTADMLGTSGTGTDTIIGCSHCNRAVITLVLVAAATLKAHTA